MQAGELKEPVEVLELQKSGTDYAWALKHETWAKAEPQKGRSLFSAIGVGMRAVKFTIRKQDITLDDAISWQGKHYFLTEITEIDHMYYEISAAEVEPKPCELVEKTVENDELNRPVASAPEVTMTFPACMTEKYMGFAQQIPQSRADVRFVLVTPKVITLALGDLIRVEGIIYNVQVQHELDEHKNEYEIAVIKEA